MLQYVKEVCVATQTNVVLINLMEHANSTLLILHIDLM